MNSYFGYEQAALTNTLTPLENPSLFTHGS